MTWQVFAALVLLAVTVGALLARTWAKNPAGRTRNLRIAVITGGLAILVIILGSTTVVSPRNVGVVTTFGRPSGTLSNGLHVKAPWQSVTEMNGTIQIDNHTGDNATTVRVGNNSTAYVDNSVRWRIQPDAADELFLDYRDFDNVRDNLVTRELKAALNEVFADFDPLNPENSDGASVQALGDEVAAKLRTKVGGQIEIINVIVPLVNYDQATQDRINALNVEKANTRIAEQRAKTAEAEAKANAILSKSVSNDPNVLVSKCLDAVRESGLSPLGCWPGTSAMPTVPAG
ncbi:MULTISPECIES: SPFH domain-containing protein [unclassified Mycobacterium]|jgi:regulator of protease activity HflC (stomatin/prohibitin superfamily)|uniref:SPFH domain-containing protein n=1 Tax=unclassified Mycobacterium TaxID=2642494 RepID=UPI0029C75DD2|nr:MULTISPECIES: SPFH domain-containing protein [unclassified Mycobacterium]